MGGRGRVHGCCAPEIRRQPSGLIVNAVTVWLWPSRTKNPVPGGESGTLAHRGDSWERERADKGRTCRCVGAPTDSPIAASPECGWSTSTSGTSNTRPSPPPAYRACCPGSRAREWREAGRATAGERLFHRGRDHAGLRNEVRERQSRGGQECCRFRALPDDGRQLRLKQQLCIAEIPPHPYPSSSPKPTQLCKGG